MPRTRLKTWPKITSQRTGWTARLKSSAGSRNSFFSSTCAMAAVSRKKSTSREGLAKAAGSVSGLADIAVSPSFFNGGATVMNENVIERGGSTKRGLQFGGLPRDGNFSSVQESQFVAKLVGLVHIMRGDEYGDAEIAAQIAEAIPDGA